MNIKAGPKTIHLCVLIKKWQYLLHIMASTVGNNFKTLAFNILTCLHSVFNMFF